MLSAGGQDIAAGQPIGKNVAAATQGNIAAQSQAKLNQRYMQILAKMLSGDIDETGAGNKLTFDDTGMSVKVAKPLPLGGGGLDAGTPTPPINPFRLTS